MYFQIVAMTETFARCILEWRYEPPYDVYNYHASAAHLLDAAKWGKVTFAVLDAEDTLVGELTVGFVDDREQWVSLAEMESGRLEGSRLWIGFGLRPDLTGRGLGGEFVQACVAFAVRHARLVYAHAMEGIGLGVYAFNQRAIRVYERAGFEVFREDARWREGKEWRRVLMWKRISAEGAGAA